MTEAFVTPEVVKWARQRRELSREAAAQRINVTPARLDSWESGTARPTFRQARTLAQKFNVPFGYLFLSSPPAQVITLPDLRTVANRPLTSASPELFDVLQDVLRKQEWYRDYQQSEGAEGLPFVARYSLTDDPRQIAADICATLSIGGDLRRRATSWDNFLRLLIRQAEGAGILVLRSGIVGNNTHRTLSVDEFRGFALSDELAPLVFINAQDGKAAQIFTFAHEIAHLWLGQSGISNLDYRRPSWQQEHDVDRLCDQVAAEMLLPSKEFLARWRDDRDIQENLEDLARQYRVSEFVVLRTAYENGKIGGRDYRDQLEARKGRTRGEAGQGGDFYRTLLSRNSSVLTLAVLAAAAEGRATYREASQLLNVKMATLPEIHRRLLEMGAGNA
jgi:Zn-dependent peptidase ImmA (M78 family)/DNA-binding XRE family transcriptional regulator